MSAPRTRRPASLVALAGLAVLHGWAAAPVAGATGHEGICPDETGVTVVVDRQDLGGEVQVRCAPDFPDDGTGLDALHLAGFIPSGTVKEGLSFICRIDDRPSADEVLTVSGQDYRESCTVTPPDWAFWSYWHAEPDGDWVHSSMGAARHVEPGGFEGWSFSLGNTSATNPPPRFDPTSPEAHSSTDTDDAVDADDEGLGGGAVASIGGIALLAGAAGLVWMRRRGAE